MLTYDNTTKAARMTATRDLVAGGSLQILTASGGVLVTYPLSSTGGVISNGLWTLTFDQGAATDVRAATGNGTAAQARIRNPAGVTHISGITVGTSGTGVIIDETAIAIGRLIQVSSASVQHAP
jgi:hypothetical protein